MKALSAADILQIWERARRLHPIDRSLVMLGAANPDVPWDQLARMPIGRRDDQLLALREHIFGARLNSFAECPHCRERLEYEVETSQLRQPVNSGVDPPLEYTSGDMPDANEPAEGVSYWMAVGEYRLRFRLPDSYDLAAIVDIPKISEARKILVQRCLLEVILDGQEMENAGNEVKHPLAYVLPSDVESQLAERIARADPQADIQFSMACPACGHTWQVTFDIGAFLWMELNRLAGQLLSEVHSLARAYGWRETDILSMSADRRQAYLEMVAR